MSVPANLNCVDFTAAGHFRSGFEEPAQQREETTNTLEGELASPAVLGLLLMTAIFMNMIGMFWCFKAYQDPYFVRDTKLKIITLWRHYTPCGILSVFSGRRPRGRTNAEALQVLNLRRAAYKHAEAEALVMAVSSRSRQQHKAQGSGCYLNKTANRSIQKSVKRNMPKNNVRFTIDNYLYSKEVGRSDTIKTTPSTREDIGIVRSKRTSFRKTNVTYYKRPLPPLPAYTFEDANVKIVITDGNDTLDVPKSDSVQESSRDHYEYLDEEYSRGERVPPVHPKPRPDDFCEPVGPGPFYLYLDEKEIFV